MGTQRIDTYSENKEEREKKTLNRTEEIWKWREIDPESKKNEVISLVPKNYTKDTPV